MVSPTDRSSAALRTRVVRTYGRGSLLGLLSPMLAAVMAAFGMRGWQELAIREMEEDAAKMARDGYRIVATQEHGIPAFGIVFYEVTYQRGEARGP